MAHLPLKAASLLVAIALVASAWREYRPAPAGSSITVKLPPAHPAAPRPGFAFEDPEKVPAPVG
jgi:hypothetical protein